MIFNESYPNWFMNLINSNGIVIYQEVDYETFRTAYLFRKGIKHFKFIMNGDNQIAAAKDPEGFWKRLYLAVLECLLPEEYKTIEEIKVEGEYDAYEVKQIK